MPEFELIYTIMTILFTVVFLLIAVFMIIMMLRAMRAPRAYYPPPARELVGQLMCPKCGSKELEPIGYYTLRCKKCGFTFSIGARRTGGVCFWPWIFPPIIWPTFLWSAQMEK